jgi:hypothetical protein
MGLGFFFNRFPDRVEVLYRSIMDITPATRRLREANAPTDWVVRFYRISGIVAVVIGFIVGVLAAVGLIR